MCVCVARPTSSSEGDVDHFSLGQSVDCLHYLLANRSTVGVVCGCFQSGSSAALLEERSRSCAAEGRAPFSAATRWFSSQRNGGRGDERKTELAGNE
ncbi:hypothetical protein SRHO_G00033270 [Serrasalmus rhombeus]